MRPPLHFAVEFRIKAAIAAPKLHGHAQGGGPLSFARQFYHDEGYHKPPRPVYGSTPRVELGVSGRADKPRRGLSWGFSGQAAPAYPENSKAKP